MKNLFFVRKCLHSADVSTGMYEKITKTSVSWLLTRFRTWFTSPHHPPTLSFLALMQNRIGTGRLNLLFLLWESRSVVQYIAPIYCPLHRTSTGTLLQCLIWRRQPQRAVVMALSSGSEKKVVMRQFSVILALLSLLHASLGLQIQHSTSTPISLLPKSNRALRLNPFNCVFDGNHFQP